jgi:hypothetical protein
MPNEFSFVRPYSLRSISGIIRQAIHGMGTVR